MDEKEFDRRAGEALGKLETALQEVSEDLDVDLAGPVLTVEFDDGARYVVNSQAAAQQIWLSANMAAWHFAWHEATGSWRDTKSGAELFTELGKLVAEKLAQPVVLRS
jgi:CyaY protein